ncbi:MAG: alanine dehydrogenase [Candidatus Gastranaerophilales bacterium]|nr:alanine dehydrogenase [Candidatus Gastranaerophilales bacterium]
MIIGIPKEIKTKEDRVAITPNGVKLLVKYNHKILIEKNAGLGSGFCDEEYINSGAQIYENPEDIYQQADMIVKVKEPQPSEYRLLKKNQILFTYLHLAVEKELTNELMKKKITAIAYETIQTPDGQLPLLIPMSEVAGKMSIQIAAHLLENKNNGAGILLGGIAGVPAGKVLIVGGGHVGINAAKIALGMGADVALADISTSQLRLIDNMFNSRVRTYVSNEENLKELVKTADVLIGAVLIPGYKAPCIITEEMVKSMKKGSVIVDVSIDQGGITETIDRITNLEKPFFEKYGVLHYSVANIPGSVARTSAIALTNETIKYIIQIAAKGIIEAAKEDSSLAKGINTFNGKLTNPGAAESLDIEYTELPSIIGF